MSKFPKRRENYGPKFYRNPTPRTFAPHKFVDFPPVPTLLLHTCWFDECMTRINPKHTLLCKFCGLRFCSSHEKRMHHLCQGPRFLPYPMRFKMFSDRVITTPTQSPQQAGNRDRDEAGTSGYQSRFIGAGDNIRECPAKRKIQIDGEEVEEEYSTSSDDDDSPKKEDKSEDEDLNEGDRIQIANQEENVEYIYPVDTQDPDAGEETDDEGGENLNLVRRKKLFKKSWSKSEVKGKKAGTTAAEDPAEEEGNEEEANDEEDNEEEERDEEVSGQIDQHDNDEEGGGAAGGGGQNIDQNDEEASEKHRIAEDEEEAIALLKRMVL